MTKGRQRARAALAAIIAVGALALAGPAAAGLKYTTVYKDHLVRGTTPQAVWSYMHANPINDPDDGPALANITHEHKLDFSTVSDDGKCKVKTLTFTWHFVITLPKAVDRGQMSAATSAMWQEFYDKVSWHEEYRRELFLKCGNEFVPAAEKMTGTSCGGLEWRIRTYVQRQYEFCMQKQEEFGSKDSPLVRKLALAKAGMAGAQ